eukprot:5941659-Lingulodinium_polyedra.AAC.1
MEAAINLGVDFAAGRNLKLGKGEEGKRVKKIRVAVGLKAHRLHRGSAVPSLTYGVTVFGANKEEQIKMRAQ